MQGAEGDAEGSHIISETPANSGSTGAGASPALPADTAASSRCGGGGGDDAMSAAVLAVDGASGRFDGTASAAEATSLAQVISPGVVHRSKGVSSGFVEPALIFASICRSKLRATPLAQKFPRVWSCAYLMELGTYDALHQSSRARHLRQAEEVLYP